MSRHSAERKKLYSDGNTERSTTSKGAKWKKEVSPENLKGWLTSYICMMSESKEWKERVEIEWLENLKLFEFQY